MALRRSTSGAPIFAFVGSESFGVSGGLKTNPEAMKGTRL
jgi:hypothetical protein